MPGWGWDWDTQDVQISTHTRTHCRPSRLGGTGRCWPAILVWTRAASRASTSPTSETCMRQHCRPCSGGLLLEQCSGGLLLEQCSGGLLLEHCSGGLLLEQCGFLSGQSVLQLHLVWPAEKNITCRSEVHAMPQLVLRYEGYQPC